MDWEPEDRAKVISYMREQSDRCVSCGTSPWEWEEDPFAYHPDAEFCPGCYVRQVAQDSEGDPLPGTTISLFPKGVFPKKIDIVSARRKNKKKKKRAK